MPSTSKTSSERSKKKASSTPAEARTGASASESLSGGQMVALRNQSVYAIYRKVISLTMVTVVMAVISVGTAVHFKNKKIPPKYVPVSETGVVVQPVPLNKPNQDNGTVAEYALKAIRAVNTYDYINWRDQLQNASVYFTPDGWGDYVKQFGAVDTIKAVQDRRMIVSVQPTGEVKVVRQAVAENGTYVWVLEAPIEITYTAHTSSLSGGTTQRGLVTLYIIRQPTTVNPKGIGIEIYQFDTSKNQVAKH